MSGAATVIPLPRPVPDAFGVGALLKATVCAIKGDIAHLSPSVGGLDDPDAILAHERTAARLLAETGCAPVVVGHDLHPDFPSTRLAERLGTRLVGVQHHHAHVAAVAAERGIDGPLLGLALDGFGLGADRGAWGGELLEVDGASMRRLGHLAEIAQPGGDIAARQPWRMGAAVLHKLGRGDEIAAYFDGLPGAGQLGQVLDRDLNCPMTSSAGRLFDAACGLLKVHPIAEREAQAPVALEALVGTPRAMDGGWRIADDGTLETLPLMARLVGMDAKAGAELFHGTLVAALVAWAARAAETTGLTDVALGGGCLYNKVLRVGLVDGLSAAGLTPVLPEKAPPGDEAVALGQAWVAALNA